jgi:hypothetical protein
LCHIDWYKWIIAICSNYILFNWCIDCLWYKTAHIKIYKKYSYSTNDENTLLVMGSSLIDVYKLSAQSFLFFTKALDISLQSRTCVILQGVLYLRIIFWTNWLWLLSVVHGGNIWGGFSISPPPRLVWTLLAFGAHKTNCYVLVVSFSYRFYKYYFWSF